MHTIPRLGFFALILSGLLNGCNKKQSNEYQAPPPPAVTVAVPVQRDVIQYGEFTGTTEPYRTVEIQARVQGILEATHYEAGTKVEEGAKLFTIDSTSFVATRNAAQADVQRYEAEAKLAETIATRTEHSAAENAVSEIKAIEARAKADVANAQVEVAKKTLAIKQLDVDYAQVHAPFGGWVERTPFDVGSLVGTSSSSVLTKVYDDSKVYVWFVVPDRMFLLSRENRGNIDEVAAPEVQLGMEIDNGFPHIGKLDYIDPTIDATTGTVRVRGLFENSDRVLLGGLFVRCRIAIRTLPDALMVPETAIGADQAGRYVYVVDDKGTVERRAIESGPHEDGMIVITEGLKSDDRVIVRGLLRARPGGKVTPQTKSTDIPAQAAAQTPPAGDN